MDQHEGEHQRYGVLVSAYAWLWGRGTRWASSQPRSARWRSTGSETQGCRHAWLPQCDTP